MTEAPPRTGTRQEPAAGTPTPANSSPTGPGRGRRSVDGARGAGAATLRAIGHSLAAVVRVWRRSLQVRVGTTTVVVAGIMVFLIGLFLVDKVSNGVLKTKRDAAVRQANLGLPVAQSVLAQIDAGVYAEVGAAAQQITATLTAGGTSAGLFSLGIGSVSDNVNREPLNVSVPLVAARGRAGRQSRRAVRRRCTRVPIRRRSCRDSSSASR